MKPHSFSKILSRISFFSFAILFAVGLFVPGLHAQTLNEAANLDQCRNGEIGSEVICAGTAYTANGNAGPQNSHYKEGDTVPYRYKMSNLTPNAANQTIIIGYDTIDNGKHALDYLTTYNRSESGADSCSDALSAAICAAPTTFPIPVDPNVVNTNLTGVQIPGVFTFHGGTITSVSGYTSTPQGGGAIRTTITITFTPTIANPILAVGGHIATRADWGAGNSAVGISGSPYHMRLLGLNGSGGNQDRSLKVSDFSTSITVIKDVANGTSATGFGFTTNSATLPASFSLTDDGNNDTVVYTPRGISSSDFSPSGTVTITENDPFGTGFQLFDIACTGTDPANISSSLVLRQVTVNVQNNESVTCTFVNASLAPSASNAKISGRALNSLGKPISKARVYLTGSSGEARTATTNALGYYTFEEIPAGETYIIEGSHKRFTFAPIVINLTDDLIAPNLIGQ